MPALDLKDRQALLGWQDRRCDQCMQYMYKNYCRQCDEFFFECDCLQKEHVGHRTY